MTENSFRARLYQCWQSFQGLPLWVQVWVGGILIPVNAAAFFMLEDWAARMTAWAALSVVATNIPIMLWERGMSKLMSVPHLLIWGPLQVLVALRLTGYIGHELPEIRELVFGIIVLLVNGISLVFDSLDTWRWFKGDRAVPGMLVD